MGFYTTSFSVKKTNKAPSTTETSISTVSETEPKTETPKNIDPDEMSAEEKEKTMAEALQSEPFIEMSNKERAHELKKIESLKKKLPKQGIFFGAEFQKRVHETKGFAQKIGEYLVFSDNFKVDAGPDLHVFLSAVRDPKNSKDLHSAGLIDLGKLKSTFGAQMYKIPKNIDFQVESIVIYCVPFKVIFGIAQIYGPGK